MGDEGAGTASGGRLARFDRFTFDLSSGELRRDDRAVKLHPQPATILTLLVRRPGEIVSRAEIRASLWEDDTFVDFELGINSGIKQLRAALSDDASSPRLVETVPRKGYRFVADVIFADAPASTWRATMARLGFVAAGVLGVVGSLFVLRSHGDFSEASWILANPIQVTSSLGVEEYPEWSPNGRTLAYSGALEGNWDIFVVERGSEPVNRTPTHTGADRFPAWSPDGSQIAFWSSRDGGGYYVMPALGGSPRRVRASGLQGGGTRPQWSRDGTTLAVIVNEEGASYVELIALETREARRHLLPGSRQFRKDLSWSPDGRFVAYVDAGDRTNARTQLNILRLEDDGLFAVNDGQGRAWSPSWSRDGSALFFTSNQEGTMELWRQTVGGDGAPLGDPERLTTGFEVRSASFSPTETTLAFTKGRLVANLWRVPILEDRRATWSDAEQLTFDRALADRPDVSPDGETLLFESDRLGTVDVWMMPAGGGEMVAVVDGPSWDSGPRWSPDGRSIAYRSDRTGQFESWIMSVDGGPAWRMAHGGPFVGWLPDSKSLVISSERTGNGDLYRVSLADDAPVQLTSHASFDTRIDTSPDGKWATFMSGRDGMPRVWRISTRRDDDPEPLTRGPGGLSRWSVDGRRLFFLGMWERVSNIWTVSLEDGSEYPVTDFEGKPGILGRYSLDTDGTYLYFTWQVDVGDIWLADVSREEVP